LRRKSLNDLIAREAPGYAIGGLAGGEDKVILILKIVIPRMISGK